MSKKVIMASDHAGFELKKELKEFLEGLGYEVEDMGARRYDPEDDYPDFIRPAAEKVVFEKGSVGIVLGGSGQGEAIVANKVKGIRAAVFYGGPEDIIRLSREHSDANVLSIGARFIDKEKIKEQVKLWLETDFEGGRHERRIEKID